jgi:hypothetical protein
MAQSSGEAVTASRAMAALEDLLGGLRLEPDSLVCLEAAADMLERLTGAPPARSTKHGPAALKTMRGVASRLTGEGRPVPTAADLEKVVEELRRLARAGAIHDQALVEKCRDVCREVAIAAIDIFNAGQREGDSTSSFDT